MKILNIMTHQEHNNTFVLLSKVLTGIMNIFLTPILSRARIYTLMGIMLISLNLWAFESSRSSRRNMVQDHGYRQASYEQTGFPIMDEGEFASATFPLSTAANVVKQVSKPEKDYSSHYIGILAVLFLTSMVKLMTFITRPIGKLRTVWGQVKGG
ncbi:MAG: hypothetical protein MJA30_13750 [Cytophagales bacterium]|nr:hypothetical protein [Cytophagales bacterium]